MSIWKSDAPLEQLKKINQNTLAEHIGIEITAIGEDYLEAKMPVDHRTKQPAGLLHGGASAVLAETLGSIASALCIDVKSQQPVGVEINVNHLKSMTKDFVIGRARPIRIGRTMHVWDIDIRSPQDERIAVSRLTVAIVPRRKL